jgi:hypothetical protein
MKHKHIHLIIFLISMAAMLSCRQEDGSPVRNVRFDPNLLSQAMDGSPCTSYSYNYQDKETSLGTVFTKQVVVSFTEGSTQAEQKKAAEKYGFVKRIGDHTASNSALLYTLELSDGLNCKQAELAIKIIEKDPAVAYIAPYFIKDNNLLGISNEAIVTVSEGGRAALDKLLLDYKASIVSALGNDVYIVKVDKNSNGNALALANHLEEQQGITHAEPDFLVKLASVSRASSDRATRADFKNPF